MKGVNVRIVEDDLKATKYIVEQVFALMAIVKQLLSQKSPTLPESFVL